MYYYYYHYADYVWTQQVDKHAIISQTLSMTLD